MQPDELARLKGVKLAGWLKSVYGRKPAYSKFSTIEINEEVKVNDQIRLFLKKLVIDALFDLQLLEDAAESLGWTRIKEMVRNKAAKGFRLQRGDFGEIITNAILEEIFGYLIPIPKLRYRIDSDQSLPGTDSIAVKWDGTSITEVCYVETKTRSSSNSVVAVEGYKQLVSDFGKPSCEMTEFVLARLRDTNNKLFAPFLTYMKDRRQNTDLESLSLGLVWEVKTWSERCLLNLENTMNSSVPKLVVLLVRLAGLKELVKVTYDAIGVTEISVEE